MPAFTATSPGKIILFGEHAVVYGRPAIAVPVQQVYVRVVVAPRIPGKAGDIVLQAPLVGMETSLASLPPEHPVATTFRLLFEHLGVKQIPPMNILITGTIPVAAGLGSGAAVSVSLIRAVSGFLGRPLDNAATNALSFEVEKIHHGTPSGIDNTVITYNQPVYFIKGRPIETFHLAAPFKILIGDTGISSPTSITVGGVRERWNAEPDRFEAIFDQVGEIAQSARRWIESGQTDALGSLMDENQNLLEEMGVSSPELEQLIRAARAAGALGAKLSGGGGGGNMIALVTEDTAAQVQAAVEAAGATQTILTTVQ